MRPREEHRTCLPQGGQSDFREPDRLHRVPFLTHSRGRLALALSFAERNQTAWQTDTRQR